MQKKEAELLAHLEFLYGKKQAPGIFTRITELVEKYQKLFLNQNIGQRKERFTEKDSILITYGDNLLQDDAHPLICLADFAKQYLKDRISTIHILPFFPYSSDDGFSVIDYRKVNPELGNWEDISEINAYFRLMFDAVVNHISAKSNWFTGYLEEKPEYKNYFIEVDPKTDLSQVFRPRALPLLTSFDLPSGKKWVWTTFSTDQIDLNFQHPELLLEVLDIILTYVLHGAEFIRLDAIAFIWKELGTSCIHLPQTHRIIQMVRTILDMIAPSISIITETNVPHQENISYFGDGGNEAQMVYNFSLPPLVLHTFQTGDASKLTRWAATLDVPSDEVTFFNFLASHDGVGLTPAKGLLSDEEISNIVDRVQKLGGRVSFKNNPDGSQSAYELNINYLNALGNTERIEEGSQLIADRFLCSQSIMLSMRGVPGIYFHSLVGSQNWQEGVEITGRNRTINREKLDYKKLKNELANPEALRHKVFYRYLNLLKQRKSHKAFHPLSDQEVLFLNDSIFGLKRVSLDGKQVICCLHNTSSNAISICLDVDKHFGQSVNFLFDLVSEKSFTLENGKLNRRLSPYEMLWLIPESDI